MSTMTIIKEIEKISKAVSDKVQESFNKIVSEVVTEKFSTLLK